MTSRADSLTFEDLQMAKESGMADIVEKLRNIDNISGDIEESEIERISIIGDAAAAEIERLRAEIACWRENSIDAHAALSAMRNSINDYLPMPSIESDLLQGPETSVFCAAVATSVIAEVCRLRAALAEVHLTINALYTERDGARAALAEAREVIRPVAKFQERIDQPHIPDWQYPGGGLTYGELRRAAKWLEANPAP